jgi:hypothetical protein
MMEMAFAGVPSIFRSLGGAQRNPGTLARALGFPRIALRSIRARYPIYGDARPLRRTGGDSHHIGIATGRLVSKRHMEICDEAICFIWPC